MSNTLTVIGNLGRDAELAYSPEGDARLTFSVADDKRRKTDAGEWETVNTNWWRVTLWREKAEALANQLVKGTRVIVTGRALIRKFETRDGETGYSTEIDYPEVAIMPRAERDGNRSGSPNSSDPWSAAPSSEEAPF